MQNAMCFILNTLQVLYFLVSTTKGGKFEDIEHNFNSTFSEHHIAHSTRCFDIWAKLSCE